MKQLVHKVIGSPDSSAELLSVDLSTFPEDLYIEEKLYHATSEQYTFITKLDDHMRELRLRYQADQIPKDLYYSYEKHLYDIKINNDAPHPVRAINEIVRAMLRRDAASKLPYLHIDGYITTGKNKDNRTIIKFVPVLLRPVPDVDHKGNIGGYIQGLRSYAQDAGIATLFVHYCKTVVLKAMSSAHGPQLLKAIQDTKQKEHLADPYSVERVLRNIVQKGFIIDDAHQYDPVPVPYFERSYISYLARNGMITEISPGYHIVHHVPAVNDDGQFKEEPVALILLKAYVRTLEEYALPMIRNISEKHEWQNFLEQIDAYLGPQKNENDPADKILTGSTELKGILEKFLRPFSPATVLEDHRLQIISAGVQVLSGLIRELTLIEKQRQKEHIVKFFEGLSKKITENSRNEKYEFKGAYDEFKGLRGEGMTIRDMRIELRKINESAISKIDDIAEYVPTFITFHREGDVFYFLDKRYMSAIKKKLSFYRREDQRIERYYQLVKAIEGDLDRHKDAEKDQELLKVIKIISADIQKNEMEYIKDRERFERKKRNQDRIRKYLPIALFSAGLLFMLSSLPAGIAVAGIGVLSALVMYLNVPTARTIRELFLPPVKDHILNGSTGKNIVRSAEAVRQGTGNGHTEAGPVPSTKRPKSSVSTVTQVSSTKTTTTNDKNKEFRGELANKVLKALTLNEKAQKGDTLSKLISHRDILTTVSELKDIKALVPKIKAAIGKKEISTEDIAKLVETTFTESANIVRLAVPNDLLLKDTDTYPSTIYIPRVYFKDGRFRSELANTFEDQMKRYPGGSKQIAYYMFLIRTLTTPSEYNKYLTRRLK